MVPLDKLNEITRRFEFIEAQMAEGGGDIAQLGREYAELRPVVEEIRAYTQSLDNLEAAEAMLNDPEMRELAEDETAEIKARLPQMEASLQLALLPKDEADGRPAILEIRPGTGGDEAALFAGDLLRMYLRYAEAHGWKVDLIEDQAPAVGGSKEVVAHITGRDVFARMKYESGVHRVQRVPSTESGGRIHTSACTVAILPEAEELEAVEINKADLRVDTYRASGAGGQHVNKTDSAVRLTHLPTGIVVECQDERSQHKNRARAMSLLQAKLASSAEAAQQKEQAEERRNLVGTGDRSDRIRTYNFPQGRVTDHRINLTLYKLDEVIAGDVDAVIEPLLQEHQADQLAALADESQLLRA